MADTRNLTLSTLLDPVDYQTLKDECAAIGEWLGSFRRWASSYPNRMSAMYKQMLEPEPDKGYLSLLDLIALLNNPSNVSYKKFIEMKKTLVRFHEKLSEQKLIIKRQVEANGELDENALNEDEKELSPLFEKAHVFAPILKTKVKKPEVNGELNEKVLTEQEKQINALLAEGYVFPDISKPSISKAKSGQSKFEEIENEMKVKLNRIQMADRFFVIYNPFKTAIKKYENTRNWARSMKKLRDEFVTDLENGGISDFKKSSFIACLQLTMKETTSQDFGQDYDQLKAARPFSYHFNTLNQKLSGIKMLPVKVKHDRPVIDEKKVRDDLLSMDEIINHANTSDLMCSKDHLSNDQITRLNELRKSKGINVECDVFLMPQPAANDNYTPSDENHLYLYNDNGKISYYLKDKENPDRGLKEFNLEPRQFPRLSDVSCFPTSQDMRIQVNNKRETDGILEITAKRGHTVNLELVYLCAYEEMLFGAYIKLRTAHPESKFADALEYYLKYDLKLPRKYNIDVPHRIKEGSPIVDTKLTRQRPNKECVGLVDFANLFDPKSKSGFNEKLLNKLVSEYDDIVLFSRDPNKPEEMNQQVPHLQKYLKKHGDFALNVKTTTGSEPDQIYQSYMKQMGVVPVNTSIFTSDLETLAKFKSPSPTAQDRDRPESNKYYFINQGKFILVEKNDKLPIMGINAGFNQENEQRLATLNAKPEAYYDLEAALEKFKKIRRYEKNSVGGHEYFRRISLFLPIGQPAKVKDSAIDKVLNYLKNEPYDAFTPDEKNALKRDRLGGLMERYRAQLPAGLKTELGLQDKKPVALTATGLTVRHGGMRH